MHIVKPSELIKHRVAIGDPPKGVSELEVYFSADVETDGPIPGPYSMLSFALVYAGAFDGNTFYRPETYSDTFYAELKPISANYDSDALAINGLNRSELEVIGDDPSEVMNAAAKWVRKISQGADPIFAGYPLGFDWTWMYWYFTNYSRNKSPFGHSKCFDIKTAAAVTLSIPLGKAGRAKLPIELQPKRQHTHHALDDAIAQAEILANIFAWESVSE